MNRIDKYLTSLDLDKHHMRIIAIDAFKAGYNLGGAHGDNGSLDYYDNEKDKNALAEEWLNEEC